MKVYLDKDYIVHLNNNEEGTLLEVETDFFDDFAPEVIEAYRFVPRGHSWTDTNGVTFNGEMVTPWIISTKIKELQWKHDKALCEEYKNALSLYEGMNAESVLAAQNDADEMLVDINYRLTLMELGIEE